MASSTSARHGDDQLIAWTEVFSPLRGEPGSDLVLLHPDGSEEVLVTAGDDSITVPFVSFDGLSVYYARMRNRQCGNDSRSSEGESEYD